MNMGIRLFSKITTQRYNYDYSRNDKFKMSFKIKSLKTQYLQRIYSKFSKE